MNKLNISKKRSKKSIFHEKLIGLSPPTNIIQQKRLNQNSAQQTQNVLKKIKQKRMMDKIISKVQSINTSRHQNNSNIKQEWEKQIQITPQTFESAQYLIKKSDRVCALLHFIFLLINTIICWYLSVIIVYQMQRVQQSIFYVWLFFLCIQIIVSLNTIRIIENRIISTRLQILKHYLINEALIDLILFIQVVLINQEIYNFIKIPYQVLTLVCLILKINNHISILKPFIDDSNFKKQFALISLFIYLLIAGHTFGLIMYSSSKFDSENNWLIHININNTHWRTQYIYSIYWAFTTMVTVGYGDITPQNQGQIVIVIMIQIFGTAIFGYMINIIGMAMAELKKQEQILQEQIGIANKISKCFSLKQDIAFRLKQFLKNNQKIYTTFSLTQEKRIFDKINPLLKAEILHQTNTKVIKKCVFLLTYFTKGFQDKIALKLVKRILHPNQLFLTSNEKIISLYIIEQGIVDILIKKNSRNKIVLKKCKTIQEKTNKQLICNIYGYSQAILGKKLEMNAMSKSFTVVYELSYKDFVESILSNPYDFEIVCELKEKFLQKELLQSIENPALINFKEHYIPNSFFIIKKYVFGSNNERKNIRRAHKKCNSRNIFLKKLQSRNSTHSRMSLLMSQINKMQQIAILHEKNWYELNIGHKITSNSDISIKSDENQPIQPLRLEQQQLFMYSFQSLKNYNNFFSNSNSQIILVKYSQYSEKKDQTTNNNQ